MTTIEKTTTTTEPDTGTTPPAASEDWMKTVPVPLDPERIAAIGAALAADPEARIPEKVNPKHVVIGSNPRELANALASLTEDYVESVKAGYRQLPSAFLRPDGIVQIIDGQRRILGARKGRLTTVQVLLQKAPEGTADQQRAALLVDQVPANVHHVELTKAELYAAQEELAGLDLPAREKTAKLRALGITDRKQAQALRTLSGSTEARNRAIDGQMNLLHAADAAEFDDDPDAMNELRYASRAGNGRFVAKLEELREERRVTALRDAEAASYRQRGFRILEHHPREADHKQCTPLAQLRTAESTEPTEADIAPSQWAVYLAHHEVSVLTATGQEIEERRVDLATHGDPEREAREGFYHARDVRSEDRFTPLYYCLDYRRAGFTRVKPGRSEQTGITAAQVGKLNKQAMYDTIARRKSAAEWLQKTAPKAGTKEAKAYPALLFEARKWRSALESALPGIFDDAGARAISAELLGIPASKIKDGSAIAKMTKPAQLDKYEIGLAMGAIERLMQREISEPRTANYWRIAQQRSHIHNMIDMTISRPYLSLLASTGHKRGIMDRVTLGETSLEDALTEIATRPAARPGSADADQDRPAAA
ncbi:hypothetical protein KO481_16950 [Nocardia sp. NEAU-G5]|uniref:ParB/Sulfiredoxin domain-containing protein n=1 Tax=Nocardia albiluteola TaxID=2842303 RepID=A0ABS6B0B9_9NOCA|nr:hypothetical protein [Nocardia albiluteola]MBU3063210.1 hypothetical protein [Nocardia albiluteola]